MLIVLGAHDREVVLSNVDAMVKDFVYQASLAHGLSESIASTSGGKIFSFVSGIEKQGCYVALADGICRDRIGWVFTALVQTLIRSAWCQSMFREKTSFLSLRVCFVSVKR